MEGLWDRFIGAMALKPRIYEDVEADPSAFWQAFGIVVVASYGLAVGIIGRWTALGVIGLVVAGIFGWAFWAGMIYLVGGIWLPERQTRANWGELLRVIGFAASPGVIGIAGILPWTTGMIAWLARLWILIAAVVATRQALDYRSSARALLVSVIGWAILAGCVMAWLGVP